MSATSDGRQIMKLKVNGWKHNFCGMFCVLLLGSIACVVDASAAELWVDGTSEDLIEDGSETYPFHKIQSAIGSALQEDTVRVKPGVYEENVVINKSLTLTGSGPDTTVIRGAGGVPLTINANLSASVKQFTITRGNGYGISLKQCSSTVTNVLENIVSASNSSHGFNQTSSCIGNVMATNCTFADNGGCGITANSKSVFYNCLFTNNGQYGTDSPNTYRNQAFYCNAYGNVSGGFSYSDVSFCTTVDPLYIDSATGDYRLSSDSPCRNTGSPGRDARNPDGSRNDMGAYGGPGAAGFYDGYGNSPVVTDLHVTPGSVGEGQTITITATGKAQ